MTTCRERPAEGARIWVNGYGDLYCDGCAERLDREHTAALARQVEAPRQAIAEARTFGAAANSGARADVGAAQAAARAARPVRPRQGELFGAAGELQPDLFGGE